MLPRSIFSTVLATALCTLALCASLRAAEPSAEQAAEKSPTINVIFVGDIMLDELPGQAIADGIDPFTPFDALFKQADITLGNLECVIATTGEKVPKPYNFRASPICIPIIKRHFSAVTVANNHSGDYGKGALAEQCDLLDQAHMPYFGGGRSFAAAHTPLVMEQNGIRLALLGYDEFKPPHFRSRPQLPRHCLERRSTGCGRHSRRPRKISRRPDHSLHALGLGIRRN
jgi:hypothetical protein